MKKNIKRIVNSVILIFALCAGAFGQNLFSFDEMMKLRRIGGHQISPDGSKVVFTIADVDVSANRSLTQIYLVSIDGTRQIQLTNAEKSSSSPVWSPDGSLIAFTHGGQIWTMKPDGTEKKQITNISTGAGGPVWSPDGKLIAFSSEVYPECPDDACNKKEDEKVESNKVQAKVTDRLLFRHWVEWRDRKRTHVFLISSEGGTARDITPGDFDSPPYAASTGIDYAFSPDSREIAFLRNPDVIEAVSTNSDIYVKAIDGNNEARNITSTNRGYDAGPVYTPDGKYLLYRSQAREGFEADRWRVMRYDRKTGETKELSIGFDLQADDLVVTKDSKTIYFTAGQHGRTPIFTVPVEPDFMLKIATHVKQILSSEESSTGGLSISDDGKTIAFSASALDYPATVMTCNSDGSGIFKLVDPNSNSVAKFGLQKAEDMEWLGAGNRKIHGFLLKPANFDPSRKYPLLVLIHGGPQGAWSNSWNYRWNASVFANAGYVVFMPNPRGSTGYGQKFVDEISGDWGGKGFVDLMNGVAEASKLPYVDKERIGAAGASYGGYMINWILGHNVDKRFKFKALVSHAGLFNFDSFFGATEELWFPLWDFKGTPWDNPVNYVRWSPNKFVRNFDTPTLVTAGELDYRVPIGESLQLYTALQLRKVDSRLVYFPDEGHWIMKPQNSKFWYGEVTNWLGKYLKP